jgi:hypothetical protein
VCAPASLVRSRADPPRCPPTPRRRSRGGRCGPLQSSTARSDDFASWGPRAAKSLDTDCGNPIHSHYPILTPMSLFHHTTPAPRNTRQVPGSHKQRQSDLAPVWRMCARRAIDRGVLAVPASCLVSDVRMKGFRLHFLSRASARHVHCDPYRGPGVNARHGLGGRRPAGAPGLLRGDATVEEPVNARDVHERMSPWR